MAADEIKIRHGYAISEAIEEDRVIDIASYDAGDGEPISRRELAQIIEARLEETFELVRESLERGGFEITRSAARTGSVQHVGSDRDADRDVRARRIDQ
jgi:cell division protein FtsA